MAAPFEIPKTARAAILKEQGTAYEIVDDDPVPVPGLGEVLVKLLCTGVCHSDCLARFPNNGLMPPSLLPLKGGHEGIGFVVARGEGVSSPALGSRVGIRWDAEACGDCEYCMTGFENICPKGKSHGWTMHGSFAEYCLGKAKFVVPIPDQLDSIQAAPLMCAGLTVYSALKLARPSAGEWLAIPGAGGGLGHLAVRYAKALFGCKVIGIDTPTKKSFVLDTLGADAFVGIDEDVVKGVIAATGGGAHSSVITTDAGIAYTQSVMYARKLGRIVCVGVASAQMPLAVVAGKLLKIVGSKTGTRQDCKEALDFAVSHKIRCEVEVRDFKELDRTLIELNEGKIKGRVVLKVAEF